MIPSQFKLKNTVKHPTSLIVGGLTKLGIEIADSLLEQGGYVIIIDSYTESNLEKLNIFTKDSLVSFIDYTSLPHLDEEIRRLDYVFYFNHEASNYLDKVSTSEFVKFSNYLDILMSLTKKFDAKFLLSTSIKANQLSVFYDDIDIKRTESHKVYTVSELQRHSESLVVEYSEKHDIDSRIVRIGEIIGEGLDFSIETSFTNLVLEAAKGENLKLYKDGLESEWFVHLLDAAYGVIKAQFTKNTKGKIYSISYDNTLTHLSIAYKLQELDEDVKEIEFVDSKDNLPSIKLYKPAPNLNVVGWTTKIPFEKALKESLSLAKIFLLETKKLDKKEDNVTNKIKSFFAIAEESEEEYDGPISKLIAERKRSEELKKHSLDLVNNRSLKRGAKSKKTFGEKLNKFLWEISISIGNSFSFLKNKSPLEFGVILASILIFLTLFFYVVSPVLVSLRSLVLATPELNYQLNSLKDNTYLEKDFNTDLLIYSLNETLTSLDGFRGVLNFLGLSEQYSETRKLIQSYLNISESVKGLINSYSSFSDYLNSYENNLILRNSTESYISTTNTGINHEDILNEIKLKSAYLESSIERFNKGVNSLKSINYGSIPEVILNQVTSINNSIFEISDSINTFTNIKYLPEILGLNEPKTYLILLLDNSIPTPIGGKISSFALITLNNGSVTEITVKSINDIDLDLSTLDEFDLKEINARKFQLIDKNSVTLNDLTSVSDPLLFNDFIDKVFTKTLNRDIKGVVSLNLNFVEDTIDLLNTKNHKVMIDNVEISSSTFLNNLLSLQSLNESIDEKNKYLSQILANTIYPLISNPKEYVVQLSNLFNQSLLEGDIILDFSELEINEYLYNSNFNYHNFNQSTITSRYGYNILDSKVINNDKYPLINISNEVLISGDYVITYVSDIGLPSLGSNSEFNLCLPLSVKDSDIEVSNIGKERYVINSGRNEKCVVVKVINEKEISVKWKLDTNIVKEEEILELLTYKVLGNSSTLDSKIVLDELFTIVSINPDVDYSGNTLIFTDNLNTSSNIVLDVFK